DVTGSVSADLQGTESLPGLVLEANGAVTVENSLMLTGFRATGGDLTGPGNVTLANGGTATLNGGKISNSGTLAVSPGATFNWDNGTMGGTGTTQIQFGGTLVIRDDNAAESMTLADARVISNGGLVTWSSSQMVASGTSSFVNAGSLTIT